MPNVGRLICESASAAWPVVWLGRRNRISTLLSRAVGQSRGRSARPTGDQASARQGRTMVRRRREGWAAGGCAAAAGGSGCWQLASQCASTLNYTNRRTEAGRHTRGEPTTNQSVGSHSLLFITPPSLALSFSSPRYPRANLSDCAWCWRLSLRRHSGVHPRADRSVCAGTVKPPFRRLL